MATWIYEINELTTDKTVVYILLNSSKQLHAPQLIKPLKNFPIEWIFKSSEQLNTTHCIPIVLAKSRIVSDFPVPDGPYIIPLRFNYIAFIKVIKHLSVKGV